MKNRDVYILASINTSKSLIYQIILVITKRSVLVISLTIPLKENLVIATL